MEKRGARVAGGAGRPEPRLGGLTRRRPCLRSAARSTRRSSNGGLRVPSEAARGAASKARERGGAKARGSKSWCTTGGGRPRPRGGRRRRGHTGQGREGIETRRRATRVFVFLSQRLDVDARRRAHVAFDVVHGVGRPLRLLVEADEDCAGGGGDVVDDPTAARARAREQRQTTNRYMRAHTPFRTPAATLRQRVDDARLLEVLAELLLLAVGSLRRGAACFFRREFRARAFQKRRLFVAAPAAHLVRHRRGRAARRRRSRQRLSATRR